VGRSTTHLYGQHTTCHVQKCIPRLLRALGGAGQYDHALAPPPPSPNVDAQAERFIQPLHVECLDRFIVIGIGHLEDLTAEFIEHNNCKHPNSAIGCVHPSADLRRHQAGPGPLPNAARWRAESLR